MNSIAKWIFTWAAAVLVLACTITPAEALDPFRLNSQYARERWGSEKGFPGASVAAFARAPDGYLWIGTDKGLIRFDGLEFRVFEPAIPGLAQMGPVQSLLTDADGNLWVLLQSTKILRYRDGKFEPGRDKAEVGITAMGRQRNGWMVFSSLAYGTLTYRGGTFEPLPSLPETLPKTPHGETGEVYNDLYAPLRHFTEHSLAEPASAVVAMAESVDGKVWLGTQDSRLFQMVEGKVSAVAKRLSAKITCLLPLKDGKLWIGTDNGVVVWNGVRLSQKDVPSSLRRRKILSIIQDRDSNIWLGTSHGLLRFNSSGASSAGRQTDAISGPVTALFEDREGNLWVGGSRSIARLRDSVFVSYSIGSLQSESSGPVYVDDEERTWFAPFDGGLHWLKDGKQGAVTKDALDRDVIYSIAGGKDELWIGRRRGGLTRLRYTNGTVVTKTYTEANGLAQNSVYAVYKSRSGSVWAATVNAGVSEYSQGRFTTYSKTNGMASDTVFSIEESQDGTMWFATPDGLNAFSKGEWRAFRIRDGLPSDNVNCLLSDSSGVLWIGTASGLAFLRSGHIQEISAPPLREEIFGIAADDIGNVWIATTNHILSAKRDRLLSSTVAESDLREYGLEDGLIGKQGVKRFRSVVSDPQGKIWFSTSRGLSVIDPSRAGREPPYVTVQIEGFSADGNSLGLQPPIQVPPDTHRLRFSYSGLSLSTPERIQFRYKLDGLDKEWSEPVSTRAAVYTNVGWGSYTFRVMACNNSGVWNEAGTFLDFSIAPAYYQTTWFRVSCVAVFLVLLGALYQLRLRQLARQFNMTLEARVSERTRIARDLHDTLLQSFQGLMLHFQTGIDLLPGRPAEARKTLEIAIDRADQAIAEGRDAVQGLRSSTVETNDLASAVRILGEELRAEGTNRTSALFEMEVEGTPRNLHPILRDEVYRITGEALRNAFRHARAHRIEVEILYGEQCLRLRVRDDGKGIDPKLFSGDGLAGHYGLHGMRERAKVVGGKLAVWSKLDSGTEVELSIPAPTAYAKRARHRSRLSEKLSGKGTGFKATV